MVSGALGDGAEIAVEVDEGGFEPVCGEGLAADGGALDIEKQGGDGVGDEVVDSILPWVGVVWRLLVIAECFGPEGCRDVAVLDGGAEYDVAIAIVDILGSACTGVMFVVEAESFGHVVSWIEVKDG